MDDRTVKPVVCRDANHERSMLNEVDIELLFFTETRIQSEQERWDPREREFLERLMLILFPQTRILLVRKLCCTTLKTTKQWSRWSWREEALQWDMFPKPTELLLIGCLIELIWTPRSNSFLWHQEPTRRHTDKGKFNTCCVEPSFVFVQYQPFYNAKKIRWRKESQQNQSRWQIWYRDAV